MRTIFLQKVRFCRIPFTSIIITMKYYSTIFLCIFHLSAGWQLPEPAFIESVMEYFTRNGIFLYLPQMSQSELAKHRKISTSRYEAIFE